MSQHYTKNTVSATAYCSKCGRTTMHRVDDGRIGPCLDCIARLEQQHNSKKAADAQADIWPAPKQESLF